jgi:hypothetical protein
MPFTSQIDEARTRYASAVDVFKRARDEVIAAKRDLARLEGKARTPEQVQANRLAQRRAQVLRTHPELRKITNKTKRREAVDAVLAQRDAPRVWRFYLDTMHFDPSTRAPKLYARNPKRFKLYTAALKLGAQMARARGEASDMDTARRIELHLQSLVDASPREVTVHYPSEWQAISRALRPEGSSPKGAAARKLLSLYQYIVRTHTESLS